MENFFAIIGGMGTMATESYIHQVNLATPAHKDQEYLNYILLNHATIPDRTAYILDHSQPNPLTPMIEDIQAINTLKPKFYTLPCNTAHYFYEELSKVAQAPILHMPKEAVATIKEIYPQAKRVGILATKGTIEHGIYDQAVLDAGYELVRPNQEIMDMTTKLIYDEIKVKNHVDSKLYQDAVAKMITEQNCDVVILGCTELSLAQEREPITDQPIVDAQVILAEKTVALAKQN
ncbi:aspartate/glutamate racemase family protein [Ligilactobacillus equi]|uniref:Aspartate racemase n=1 Tax=Ligilactobacillus equi DPC 6820 TaxID=1392007 RepID=V7I0P8_9LACO|nr:amino acid racemase [Ligilactobacillus equi]ETA75125.1 aspartate racemase [Ligilactobacillus equi DPC 6820]